MNEQSHTDIDKQALRIAYLIAGFIRKTLTKSEHDELDAWVEASDENMKLFEDLTDEKNVEENLRWMDGLNTEAQLTKVKQGLAFNPTSKKTRSRRLWTYSLAAAALVIVLALSIIRYMSPSKNNDPAVATVDFPNILPQMNSTTLQLGDGTVIDLASRDVGEIKEADGANKAGDAQLSYEGQGSHVAMTYHTLITSVGGQYQLQLSDGTKVWLNASSSLKYPVSFPGAERVVELSGEGYFEVAKDAGKPFRVKLAKDEEVRVLGTHFNVSNYSDDAQRKITLLEGSVEVAYKNRKQLLVPGQQATIAEAGLIMSTPGNMEEVVGWKNGLFVFNDADIKTIMKQVKRWYDVDVVYKDEVGHYFNATISRNEPLSKLLRLLELTGKIHFKIENKTIYVLQ